jgi:uncharacterized protein YuzE
LHINKQRKKVATIETMKIVFTKHAKEMLCEKKSKGLECRYMKVKYDPVADTIYIKLVKSLKSTKTIEASDDVLLDYNGKKLIGIEIGDASKKVPEKELETISNVTPLFA